MLIRVHPWLKKNAWRVRRAHILREGLDTFCHTASLPPSDDRGGKYLGFGPEDFGLVI